MRIAVVGSGGREHAILTALNKSKDAEKLFAIPGNAGMADIATLIPVKVMDFEGIYQAVKENAIDLVFVAPDDPLAAGLVDFLEDKGIRAFGPHKNAAIIEGSKAFSKDFMQRHGIPTAEYAAFDDYDKARAYLQTAAYPLVIKADGLALGKGVIICPNLPSAESALSEMMIDKVFSSAGDRVVIEEFLTGSEVSVLTFTDGKTVKVMPSSQDHKRAFDNDKGPNTGGMGAFSPSPLYTEEVADYTLKNIIIPTVDGMREEGREFRGVLYFGLMLTPSGVKVLEYNARFGDPETQAVLPLLESDFLEIINAVIDGKLADVDIKWAKKSAVTVVVASGGYPTNVIKGYPIKIETLSPSLTLFHAGTAEKNGELVTNGGRVFALTAIADSIGAARKAVYSEIDKITFTDARYRKDIGIKYGE